MNWHFAWPNFVSHFSILLVIVNFSNNCLFQIMWSIIYVPVVGSVLVDCCTSALCSCSGVVLLSDISHCILLTYCYAWHCVPLVVCSWPTGLVPFGSQNFGIVALPDVICRVVLFWCLLSLYLWFTLRGCHRKAMGFGCVEIILCRLFIS
jgi:hypothetical protein